MYGGCNADFLHPKKEQYGFDCDDPNYYVVKVTIVGNDLKKRSPIELNGVMSPSLSRYEAIKFTSLKKLLHSLRDYATMKE